MQALCCLDVQGPSAMDLAVEFINDSRENHDTLRAARKLLTDCWHSRAQIDEILARHARHWDLHRLALVDRNVLRLAGHELLEGKAPPKVVIAEAVHLVKEFSSAESPRFVNGVLDAVAREIHGPLDRRP
jgi:N utilization substance protein B